MGDEIVVGIICTILGGLGTWLFQEWFRALGRPRIHLSFNAKDTYTWATAMMDNGINSNFLYMHINVENKSSTIARDCTVYLTKLEKKTNDRWEMLPLASHLVLHWANEALERGFKGLDINGHDCRRVDLIHGRVGSQGCALFIESGPRGLNNSFEPGTYKFTLHATGKNIKPVNQKFVMEWEGSFVDDNIIIEEEKI